MPDPNWIDDRIVTEEIPLYPVRIAAHRHFAGHALARLRIETRSDWLVGVGHDLLVTLSTTLLSEKVQDETKTVEVWVPASWWQHFKQDCFPAWVLQRWPVRRCCLQRTVQFTAHATYPKLPEVFPPEQYGGTIAYVQRVTEMSSGPHETVQ